MAAPSSLGRGLASIIPPKRSESQSRASVPPTSDTQLPADAQVVRQVPTESIAPNPHQPRHQFGHPELEALVDSIKVHGILQPLVVTSAGDDRYELIAGERRLRAAQLLELPSVPVLVRSATDTEKLELALIENVQRADLNPIERALGYQKLIENFGLTQEQVAERIGGSRTAVANTLRLLQLPDEIREALRDGRVSEGQAKVLLSVPEHADRLRYFKKMLTEHLTVRQLESVTKGKRRSPKTAKASGDIADVNQETRLREYLGTKVAIERSGDEGQLVIHYYSDEELQSIVERILKSGS